MAQEQGSTLSRQAWVLVLPSLPTAPPTAQAGQAPSSTKMFVSTFPRGLPQVSAEGLRGIPDAAMTPNLQPTSTSSYPALEGGELGSHPSSQLRRLEGRGARDGILHWESKHLGLLCDFATGELENPTLPCWGGGLQPRYTDTASKAELGRAEVGDHLQGTSSRTSESLRGLAKMQI